ncbi:aspartate 1-decarboxylase [Ornithinibacillus sp. BX22]|uniref:Aspartate 1-decarboxylase n=1 Tax=Ornithinibacillus hominis TaxID=2763055 RepID=A0A923L6Z7_9BACI|nr:aspartate 1-decarboxylase [Ornithinibacillus hominis]MBC5637556.1 aspartate 1-decarboxylase [Ornithinibacillus hominis]
MNVTMLKGKLHRAKVTEANLNYVGSITIDEHLMEAAGILEYELVQVVDINNGSRFETYVIKGERGSGMVCLNGAAARLVQVGDNVIIMSYAQLSLEETANHKPKVVLLSEDNQIMELTDSITHGGQARS